MTLDEKLEQFYNVTIESATTRNIEIVEEYKASLTKTLEDHKREAIRKSEEAYKLESEDLIREKNRSLSAEAINVKRKLNEKILELSDTLFEDVLVKLQAYMKTKDYEDLLVKQIKNAKEFAREDEMTIYIDPTDEHLKQSLEDTTGVTLTVSSYDFVGGTRAVIPAKNILIDHSFTSKLKELKEKEVSLTYECKR